MAVKIRLQRRGRKVNPFYHIVVADARAPKDGKFIEKIGTYNPMTKPATIDLDRDRAFEWLRKGAQPTDTALAILRFKGVMYKKHLMRGLAKGALTEEQVEAMYQNWINDKEAKLESRVIKTEEEKAEWLKNISDASKKINPDSSDQRGDESKVIQLQEDKLLSGEIITEDQEENLNEDLVKIVDDTKKPNLELIIDGDFDLFDEKAKLEFIEKLESVLNSSNFSIKDIKAGSIILTIEFEDEEDADKLMQLYYSKKLNDLGVKNAKILEYKNQKEEKKKIFKINDLVNNVKNELIENNVSKALVFLNGALTPSSPKKNDVTSLLSQYNKKVRDGIRGVVKKKKVDLEVNNIKYQTILLVDSINEKDLL